MSVSRSTHSSAHHNAVRGSEVFVGGLSRTTTENKIMESFSSCGEILELRLIKDQTGNSKGYCFIRFETKEGADRALKDKSGIMIDGKKVGVLPSTEQESLYLGNIHKEWSADDFEKIVRQAFKDVESVDLALPFNTGDALVGQKQKNRGFAIVNFSSHAAAARAHRVGSAPDFVLGSTCHPVVKWAELEPEIDPEELAKVKIAFVRNVPPDADEKYLEKLFQPFGKVDKVHISKKSRSPVGFVYFTTRSDLDKAIKGMNGKTVKGPNGGEPYNLVVEVAKPSSEKSKKRGREDPPQIEQRSKLLSFPSKVEPVITFGGSKYVTQEQHYSMEAPVVTDPYEAAVLSLSDTVKERLLRILRLGIATRFDIGIHCLDSLKELPEPAAISILDQFMLSGADEHNKTEYLSSLISRHQVNGLGRHSHDLNLSRISENIPNESHVSSFSSRSHLLPGDSLSSRTHIPVMDSLSGRVDRVHRTAMDYLDGRVRLPDVDPLASRGNPTAVDSLASRANLPTVNSPSSYLGTSLSRYDTYSDPYPSITDTYASRYTPQSLSNRLGIGRVDEASPPSLYQTPALSSSSSLYSRAGLYSSPVTAVTAVPDRQPTKPRMRFDPYTGEPYKFDPFTGEPIVPEALSRHSPRPY